MFYKLEENDDGNVVDATGKKYLLLECTMAQSAQGVNIGFSEFPTRTDALAHYGVEEIPEAELFPQPPEE